MAPLLYSLLGFCAGATLAAAFLRPRHGGSRRPLASALTRDGGPRTPATATTARTSSSPPPGAASADWGARHRLPLPSRPTARGYSGSVTAARGANGAPPERAD